MKNIKLWMLTLVFLFSSCGFARPVRSFKVKGPVKALCFAPDLSICAIAREIDEGFAQVEIWDMHKGRLLHKLSRISNYQPLMALSADRRYLAVQDAKTIKVWNAHTGKLLRIFRNFSPASGPSVAISPTGKYVAGSGGEYGIWLWELKTGKLLGIRDPSFPRPILFSPSDKDYLVLAQRLDINNDPKMKFQDVASGKVYWETSYDGYIYTAMFSPDGKTVVIAGGLSEPIDENLPTPRTGFSLWSVATGKQIYTRSWIVAEENEDSIYAVSFSRDGSLLAIASDRTFRIWQTKTGKLVKVLDKSKIPIRTVSFSSKENLLATAYANGRISIWRVPR